MVEEKVEKIEKVEKKVGEVEKSVPGMRNASTTRRLAFCRVWPRRGAGCPPRVRRGGAGQ